VVSVTDPYGRILGFEDVQHRLKICLDHLICVKMVAFQFYLESEKQRSRADGDTVMLFLVKNALVKNEVSDVSLS
jgi:hypothetical protein